MSEERWFDLIGFEGRYVATADGKRVRSLGNRWRCGTSLRTSPPAEVHMTNGRFQIKDKGATNKHFRPDQIVAMLGKEHKR